MAKKRNLNDLPPDLKKPIRVDQILAEKTKRRRAGLDHHGILSAELDRRVALMAQYLGIHAMPTDATSLDELERIVEQLSRRENRWEVFRRIALAHQTCSWPRTRFGC
jgi:hypothetical protein